MENLKVNHEFLEVENNVKKLWTGIQKLLKRNAVLKEMCQALEDHRASEREVILLVDKYISCIIFILKNRSFY